MKGTTAHDSDLIERRAKPPTNDFPTKAECAAIKAPPKKSVLAKARIPMSAISERSLLARPDGWYLKLDCEGFTPTKEFAYFGTETQIAALFRKRPEYANLRRVPYVTVFAIGTSKRQDPS